MAILLRNTRTGLFYQGYNRWRMHPEEAFDFQTPARAARWIDAMQISCIEVVRLSDVPSTREDGGSGNKRG
jgi:hypothetical protein